ncbi:MAG: hypothetical protein ICV51_06845 [Flavisolibacter sp.]|nr:hypothetical protein [Flavisolibacter sp.]MBD0284950.1 hypothetical protein [Flavisolibacter sp.]MBD0297005.1 hypothetical protein [Flavisolibacter sp.]MBD0351416.1 hypothetical protein [Flavisolibacter sp.]MBD0366075.1 hypothetical protein [Flavisolibacter sp.]
MTSSIIILLNLFLVSLFACNSHTEEPNLSTLDSNTVVSGDSIPPAIYLDNPEIDTSFPVAMDSAGATIRPEDTNYLKK